MRNPGWNLEKKSGETPDGLPMNLYKNSEGTPENSRSNYWRNRQKNTYSHPMGILCGISYWMPGEILEWIPSGFSGKITKYNLVGIITVFKFTSIKGFHHSFATIDSGYIWKFHKFQIHKSICLFSLKPRMTYVYYSFGTRIDAFKNDTLPGMDYLL